MENKKTTREVLTEKVSGIKEQFDKTKKIAASLGLSGGAIADLARPLGPWTLILALLFLVLAGVSAYLWFGKASKQLEEALSQGVMSLQDYNEEVSNNIFIKLFAYSSVIGGVFVFFFAFNAFAGKTVDNKPRGALASLIKPLQSIQNSLLGIKKDLKEIKQGIGEIKKGIDKLGQLGGIIATPKKAEDFYHNARIYELRGDRGNARKAYAKYLTFDSKHIDPHLAYIRILKDSEGLSETRRIYRRLKQKYPNNPAVAFAYVLLMEDKVRLQMLKDLLQKYPDYLPIIARLTFEYSAQQLGMQTNANRREELRYLKLFKEKDGFKRFLAFYIDKKEGLKELQRLKAVFKLYENNAYLKDMVKKPVKLRATAVNKNLYSLVIIPSELTSEIWYKLKGMSSFKSTGFLPTKNPVTGKPMPKSYLMTSRLHVGENTVWIKYKDAKGKIIGPMKLKVNIASKEVAQAKNFVAYQWSNPLMRRVFVNYVRGRSLFFILWANNPKIFRWLKYSFDRPTLDKYYIRNGRKVRRNLRRYLSRKRRHTLYIKGKLVTGWTTGLLKYTFTPKYRGNDRLNPQQ